MSSWKYSTSATVRCRYILYFFWGKYESIIIGNYYQFWGASNLGGLGYCPTLSNGNYAPEIITFCYSAFISYEEAWDPWNLRSSEMNEIRCVCASLLWASIQIYWINISVGQSDSWTSWMFTTGLCRKNEWNRQVDCTLPLILDWMVSLEN